jgi:hypothetical protein
MLRTLSFAENLDPEIILKSLACLAPSPER